MSGPSQQESVKTVLTKFKLTQAGTCERTRGEEIRKWGTQRQIYTNTECVTQSYSRPVETEQLVIKEAATSEISAYQRKFSKGKIKSNF